MNRTAEGGDDLKKKQTKEEMKEILEETVYKAKRMIIKGDVDMSIREISETIQQAISVFHDSAIELLPSYITMAEAYVCKGGSKLKKGEKLLIVAYWNLLKQTSDENKNAASE